MELAAAYVRQRHPVGALRVLPPSPPVHPGQIQAAVPAHALRVSLWALLCLLVLSGVPSWAHPYHTSFAEMEWNSEVTALEVSLRVLPEDLEQALSWREGRAITLEQDALARPAIQSYLSEHFLVLDDSSTRYPLLLEGYEVAYDETWLYFTVTVPGNTPLTLRNTLLLDVNETQTNRVQRLWRDPGEVLVYTASARDHRL